MEELELSVGIIFQKSKQEVDVYIQRAVFKTAAAADRKVEAGTSLET